MVCHRMLSKKNTLHNTTSVGASDSEWNGCSAKNSLAWAAAEVMSSSGSGRATACSSPRANRRGVAPRLTASAARSQSEGPLQREDQHRGVVDQMQAQLDDLTFSNLGGGSTGEVSLWRHEAATGRSCAGATICGCPGGSPQGSHGGFARRAHPHGLDRYSPNAPCYGHISDVRGGKRGFVKDEHVHKLPHLPTGAWRRMIARWRPTPTSPRNYCQDLV